MNQPSQAPEGAVKSGGSDGLFLPDFCNVRVVFAVVIISELLAFVLTLAPTGARSDVWDGLSLISLFVQWVALSSTALLCLARPWLRRFGNRPAAGFSYLIVLAVTAALSEITYRIAHHADIGVVLPAYWHSGFLLRNLGIGAIVGAVALRYFYVQYQWKRHIEAEARARVQALQARIRPHFLFNSMNTIAALTRSRPELAEEAVQDLADVFRATLGDAHSQFSLETELTVARRYLHIEKLRLGERLTVEWDIGDLPLDAQLPALTLQPLLENAIYHGIEPLPEGGTIRIEGRLENGAVRLVISNPLPPAAQRTRSRGNRMALDNIRERMAFAYGGRGALKINESDTRFTVELSFPAAPPAEAPQEGA